MEAPAPGEIWKQKSIEDFKERQLLECVWNLSQGSETALARPPWHSTRMTRSIDGVSVKILQQTGA